ncbi:MAG: hypothetical protein WCI92_05625 [Bacteroidota bacterium]
MKRILPLVFILSIILSGCSTSKKQLQKGNYDAAIEKAVKQLRKDGSDAKQIEILDQAYTKANDRDNEQIRFLKMEGQPDNWDEIYQLYRALNDRQALVKTVTPLNLNGKTVDYQYVDYMPDMIATKRRAADFYYAHGIELMKNNQKDSYRQAYAEFVRAKEYMGDYEGINAKIQDAKQRGMSKVLVSVQNNSIIKFPPEFERDLISLDLPRLNSEWVEYYTRDMGNNTQYDFFVNVNVNNVAVSPDKVVQKDSVVKKEVEDGFTYALDRKGNVMKDTLGNDIKIKKYKNLQCALVQSVQLKACQIDGFVEVIQADPQKVLKKDPIGARSNFEYISARAIGDTQALNTKQLELIKSNPAPFPDDFDMVMRCSESLKVAIRDAIQHNKRFIY